MIVTAPGPSRGTYVRVLATGERGIIVGTHGIGLSMQLRVQVVDEPGDSPARLGHTDWYGLKDVFWATKNAWLRERGM